MSKHISTVTPFYELGLKLLAGDSSGSTVTIPLQYRNVRKPGEGHTRRTRKDSLPRYVVHTSVTHMRVGDTQRRMAQLRYKVSLDAQISFK